MRKTSVLKYIVYVFLGISLFFSSCAISEQLVTGAAFFAGASGVVEPEMAVRLADTGIKISKTLEVITPSQEYYIGRAVAGSILGRYELVDSPMMESYLNKICMSLVINSPIPEIYNGYHVAIIDSENINAFATPGGHILVTSGLIRATANEEELAAVIAHEIAHIQCKHAIKAIKSTRATSAITATASTVIAAGDNKNLKNLVDGFGDTIDDVISTMIDSGYSQSTEFEADETGMQLLYFAGYNPYAMRKMLVALEKNIGNSKAGFGSTHPSPNNRIKNIKKAEKNLRKKYADFSEVEMTFEQKIRYEATLKDFR
ncbi:MAG TPA: M48 family metalloprotease [Treponemataceae bacterium]|nr:M48 family metalloprotease [Treponemataceae bacterium]